MFYYTAAATRRGRYTNEFKADNIRAAKALQVKTTNIKPEENDTETHSKEISHDTERTRSYSTGENQVTSTTDVEGEINFSVCCFVLHGGRGWSGLMHTGSKLHEWIAKMECRICSLVDGMDLLEAKAAYL